MSLARTRRGLSMKVACDCIYLRDTHIQTGGHLKGNCDESEIRFSGIVDLNLMREKACVSASVCVCVCNLLYSQQGKHDMGFCCGATNLTATNSKLMTTHP